MGIERAKEQAAAAGVTIDTTLTDFDSFDWGTDRWDLVALMYFPCAKPGLEKIRDAVKPGGWIVVERYSNQVRGAAAETGRYQRNLLASVFMEWDIYYFELHPDDGDWHWGRKDRKSKSQIERLVARKPPRPE